MPMHILARTNMGNYKIFSMTCLLWRVRIAEHIKLIYHLSDSHAKKRKEKKVKKVLCVRQQMSLPVSPRKFINIIYCCQTRDTAVYIFHYTHPKDQLQVHNFTFYLSQLAILNFLLWCHPTISTHQNLWLLVRYSSVFVLFYVCVCVYTVFL